MLRSAKCFFLRRCCLCAATRAARQGERRLSISHTGTSSRRAEPEVAAEAVAAPGSLSRHMSTTGTFTQALAAVTPPESSPHACHRPLFPSPSLAFVLPPLSYKKGVWPPHQPQVRGMGMIITLSCGQMWCPLTCCLCPV